MGDNTEKLVVSLTEMRDACAAAMRVLAKWELAEEFEKELIRVGVKNGFGVRANELLKEL